MNFKKIRKVIAAFLFTVMLGVVGSSIVGAVPPPPGAGGEAGGGAPETSAPAAKELKIKKVLTLPEAGVKTPATTFTFSFKEHSKNNDTTKKGELPAIADQTATYQNQMDTDEDANTAGKQVSALSADALANVTFATSGIYTYTVTEVAGNDAGVTYSKASYLVSIVVETNDAGTLEVTRIEVKQEMNDAGTATGTGKNEYVPEKENNNLVFHNNYEKKDGDNENPENQTKGFVLKKVVKDTENKNEVFTFQLTVNKPAGSQSTENTFKYITPDGTETEAAYGTAFDVPLKADQQVVFKNVMLGSTVKVKETNNNGYTESIQEGSLMNGQPVDLKTLNTDGMVIGEEGENSVIYVNTAQTPTGILLDNLPFIVLAALAGGGIFFFVKNRKNEEEMIA